MGRRVRFVTPKVVRLELSDGDWIEVKERLTVGEARAAMSSFVGSYRPDGSRTPNLDTLGMGQVLAYLTDWSFVDENDKRVPVSIDTIKNLDLDTYGEIDSALDRHIASMNEADAEREKKIPNGAAA